MNFKISFFLLFILSLSTFNAQGKGMGIYKVLTTEQMSILDTSGEFAGSEHDIRDGYIHMVGDEQLERVISKYYSNFQEIYILKFDHESFGEDLVFEEASDGNMYPHLYNISLSKALVLNIEKRLQ